MRATVRVIRRDCQPVGVGIMIAASRLAQALLLTALFALSACQSALLQEGVTRAAPTPAPQVEATSGEPADVLAAFIAAWDDVDYEAMYRLIARRSRELYTLQRFITQYTACAQRHPIRRCHALAHKRRSSRHNRDHPL